MKNFFSILKGNIATKALDYAPNFFNAVQRFDLSDSKFPSEALQAFKGSINNKDNWGMFGNAIAKVAIDYVTTPKSETNAALPPTTGTIVNVAPALPLEDVTVDIPKPVIVIPVKRNMRRPVRTPMRRPIRRPMKRNIERTVADLTAPKKKPRKRVYKNAL